MVEGPSVFTTMSWKALGGEPGGDGAGVEGPLVQGPSGRCRMLDEATSWPGILEAGSSVRVY